MEAGLKHARGASKGFATDTLRDLKGIDRQIGKLNKGILGLSDARSVGNLLGFAGGGLLGGAVGGAAFDAAWKSVEGFIDRAEKGAALVVQKLNEAEAAGKRLEGIDLITAHQIRNAQMAVDALRGKDDGGVGAAAGIAPIKEALGSGILEAQAKLSEHAQTMQKAWGLIPDAFKAAVPGAKQMEEAMQAAAEYGKELRDASREHAEATARAAELQKQVNQRAFKPVVGEAEAGLAWIRGAAGNAQAALEAAQQDRNQRAFAQRVLDELDRMDAMGKERATDPGGTAAVVAGGRAFSAMQKFQRMAEIQAAKPDAAERDVKRIAEKTLEVEKAQLKKLNDVVGELGELGKIKQAKF